MMASAFPFLAAVMAMIPTAVADQSRIKLDPQVELTQGLKYLQACAKAQPVNKSVRVNQSWSFPCSDGQDGKEKERTYSGTYELVNTAQGIRVHLNLVFMYFGDSGERQKARERAEAALQVVRKVFARHSLALVVDTHLLDAGSSTSWLNSVLKRSLPALGAAACDHVVVLENKSVGEIRPWSDRWYVDDWRPDAVVFNTTVHEFFHLLGLEDSYSDRVLCPDGEVIEGGPFISSDPRPDEGKDVTDRYLTFAQVLRLFSPLCGPLPAEGGGAAVPNGGGENPDGGNPPGGAP